MGFSGGERGRNTTRGVRGVKGGLVPTYLDVQEVGRVLEGRLVPVQVAHPLVYGRVAGADIADIALEVLHVHGLFPFVSLGRQAFGGVTALKKKGKHINAGNGENEKTPLKS